MAKNNDRMSGAVDQEAFETVIRDNLSPEGVTAVIAFLRAAESFHPRRPETEKALQQVEWLANTLTDMLGSDQYNRLLDEIGL